MSQIRITIDTATWDITHYEHVGPVIDLDPVTEAWIIETDRELTDIDTLRGDDG